MLCGDVSGKGATKKTSKIHNGEVKPVSICIRGRTGLKFVVGLEKVPNVSPVICIAQSPTGVICEGLFWRCWDFEPSPHHADSRPRSVKWRDAF